MEGEKGAVQEEAVWAVARAEAQVVAEWVAAKAAAATARDWMDLVEGEMARVEG